MGRRVRANDPTKRVRRKPEPVEVKQIAHPRVWATALRLAEGNMTRITVESFARVTVVLPS